jgi:ACS family hexuronate transporter-like MFS transporter
LNGKQDSLFVSSRLRGKVNGLRWWIIGLIGLATIINYIDRNALAIMWPAISKDLDMSEQQYAFIVSVFMIAYAAGQALSGGLFDRIGTRMGFLVTISVWSLACMGHSLARSVVSFSAARALLGISEAGNWPGATKSNCEWHPIKERAFAQGLFNAGASLGAVISAPLVAFCYLWLGWQATFVLLGCLGILWIVPWLVVNKSAPSTHPWISEAERQYILAGQQVPATSGENERTLGFKELCTYRESWSVILGRFFLDPIWWMFVNWLPIYLAKSYGFDVKQIGIFAWVPYLGAAAGSLIGGWYSGHLIAGGMSADRARKRAMLIGAAIQLPTLIAAAYAYTPLIAVLLCAVILFGFQFTINNLQTLPSDFFSGKSVGSLAGLGGMSAALGVLITSNLVPIITRESYVPFFLMGATVVPLSIASIFLFARRIERVRLRGL